MQRTLILLVILLVLGGISAWYLLEGPDDKTTLAGWDRDFAVRDTAQIYRIFLADRSGDRTTLERQGDHWVYNGRWRARPNAMDNLLDAVRRIEMKYKPPTAMVPNMVRDLAANGIKVELYDRRNQLIKAYYVGGGTADELGAYVIREKAEQPYVAHIPGWTGNLRYRYDLHGEEWRDKTVFSLPLEQIQSVTVDYPKQRNKSFRVERSGNRYQVTPLYPATPAIDHPYRKGSAEQFLAGFEQLGAEAFENQNPRRDSVRQLVPFAVVTVTDRGGAEQAARFFPIFRQPVLDPTTGRVLSTDVAERYFADLNTGDFMLVQNRVFKKIFWAYDFFFEEAR